MSASVYVRYEVIRTFRNRRFFIFSLLFPLALFVVVAGAHRSARIDGIGFPLYYMTSMAGYGSMMAVVATGSRISLERSVGWLRQVRITPLSSTAYFGSKILSGYLMAALSIVLLDLAGGLIGVRLDLHQWLTMTGLLLIGLAPLAVLGILIGHLLAPDALGPAMGGLVSFLALLGGSFGPLIRGGLFQRLVELLPSYWLVRAAKSSVSGTGWPLEGWLVIAAWSAILVGVAMVVYRRDESKY